MCIRDSSGCDLFSETTFVVDVTLRVVVLFFAGAFGAVAEEERLRVAIKGHFRVYLSIIHQT